MVNKAALQSLGRATFIYAVEGESLNPVPIPVVGVVNDGRDDARIYVNILGFSRFADHLWSSSAVLVYIFDDKNIGREAMRSSISDILFDLSQGEVAEISEMTSESVYIDVANFLQVAFLVCAILLLFVSAVGLVNIGLATLEQRTRELLVRRSLGATRSSVAMLVLGGSFVLALCVSALAIIVSMGFVGIATSMLPHDSPVGPISFPAGAAAVAACSAVVTALLGGAVPAVRAANLQPALALR